MATTADDRITIRAGDLKAKVVRASQVTGISESEWVRVALADFFEKNKTPDLLMKAKLRAAQREVAA